MKDMKQKSNITTNSNIKCSPVMLIWLLFEQSVTWRVNLWIEVLQLGMAMCTGTSQDSEEPKKCDHH